MLPKSDWAPLIPHAGAMCLLDAVLAWDAGSIDALARCRAGADHPLAGASGLHAVHLAEYAAQAAAVHGALLARSTGEGGARPGFLVSVRDLRLEVEYVDPRDGDLAVHAECLHRDARGAHYAFRVLQRDSLLGSGRLAILHPSGLQEHVPP